ncbi:hypothetical protein [Nocardiopsis valliformis]|uniref:hypothetical protein n=1 Tax=Nocardiopsis valliformis TaxID=239974 RepID=UPI000344928C|nr:hypothetical protein [Nocardiopsis valliformis]
MFELFFAWTVFTIVLGKSVEAVTHAWKGTTPPGHERRMARIRAREAKAARRDVAPTEGFRGWARLIWADSWNAAAERHRERWPDKVAKKRVRARQRWAWWDGVEDEAAERWEQRRRERERQEAARAHEEAARARQEAQRAQAEAERVRRQAQEDARRWAEQARRQAADSEELARERERARQAQERAERAERQARQAAEAARRAQERAERAEREAARPTTTATPVPDPDPVEEEDIPDAEIVTPELEATPASETDTTTEPAPMPNFTNEESNDMSDNTTEAIGLDGAIAFAQGVVATSNANVSTTETVVAAMENGRVGASVVGRTQQLMEAMDAVKTTAEALQADLERMKGVQEQYDANPDAGDKDYVATNSGR